MTATRPIDEELAWRACCRRDAAYEGQFFLGVKTTGIYCRPTCPARTPLRKNVLFFRTAAEARAHGLRACKRCKPDALRPDDEAKATILRVCRQVMRSEDPPSLSEMAEAAGMSRSHFHRLFKRWLGVTPKQFVASQKVERLRRGLEEGMSATDAIYAAGFGSGSRVYESAQKNLGMTPGQLRKAGLGLTIEYTVVRCPLGWLLAAATPRGICSIEIGDSRKALTESVRVRFAAARLIQSKGELRDWVRTIVALIERPGDTVAELPLDIQGTAFQCRVWSALREIPVGETVSYQQIAKAIGQPAAVRAVAQACAANKLALVIPCHRVVRQDGTIGGYRWGAQRKAQLLEAEKEAR